MIRPIRPVFTILFKLPQYYEYVHSNLKGSPTYNVHKEIRDLTPPAVHVRSHEPDPSTFVDVHVRST